MRRPIGKPKRLLILDVDGLRQDVFHQALQLRRIPNLAGLIGGANASWGIHLDPCSTAPSITFCAQSTLFTGANPDRHGIAGNQFFDRFGKNSGGVPRFYAFDIGDALAVDDAVQAFAGKSGLLGETLSLETPTLYERAGAKGDDSTVTYHMLSRGATRWQKPNLIDIARLTKGGGLVGMSAEQYDREMIDLILQDLRAGDRPTVLTAYFMGLDHESHHKGPEVQIEYLSKIVDVQVGRLVHEMIQAGMLENLLVVVVSDHGQIRVIPDDRHSLRLSFPFDREMGFLFDALGLDVHDVPGESPNCDAVVASNGGMAHVYLQNRAGHWRDRPRFSLDVLRVGHAFWEAHASGKYAHDLQGALAMVLARNVEQDGWEADYQALTPAGTLVPVDDYLQQHPEIQTVDAVWRLRSLSGVHSGDLLLVSNYEKQFYFGGITVGVHGGLHPEDSLAVASLAWLGAGKDQVDYLRETAAGMVADRCRADGRRYASLADIVPILSHLFEWEDRDGSN
jgi:hypothetical protein